MSKINRTQRKAARQERRAEKQENRQERRAEKQEKRQERRAERQENRQERRAERQENRQERRQQRLEGRLERRENRQTARAERRETRQEARAERKGNAEPKIIITTEQTEASRGSKTQLDQAVGGPIDGTVENRLVTGERKMVGASESGADAASSSAPFKDVDDAVALFESDPRAFFEKLNSMGSEDRAAWLMMVQQQIQQTNQLVSALTNFQKAQHDTQKAVLANLRV